METEALDDASKNYPSALSERRSESPQRLRKASLLSEPSTPPAGTPNANRHGGFATERSVTIRASEGDAKSITPDSQRQYTRRGSCVGGGGAAATAGAARSTAYEKAMETGALRQLEEMATTFRGARFPSIT